MKPFYFSLNIPVTGISFEQAERFCSWKEKQINTRLHKNLKVALPSPSLYTQIIENRDSFNIKRCALYNSKFCNCLVQNKNKEYKHQGKCLMEVMSYWPSNLGIYNLQGNASEMTNIKGIAKGGSFRHYAIDTRNEMEQTYKEPADWLGFRYILIKEYQK